MKKSILLLPLLMLCNSLFGQYLNKARVDKVTKLFTIEANIRKDHCIIGYSKPDIKSIKLICISIFTSDVEHNKYNCPLGAYYDTYRLPQGDEIYFTKFTGRFAQMKYVGSAGSQTVFYIKKNLMKVED